MTKKTFPFGALKLAMAVTSVLMSSCDDNSKYSPRERPNNQSQANPEQMRNLNEAEAACKACLDAYEKCTKKNTDRYHACMESEEVAARAKCEKGESIGVLGKPTKGVGVLDKLTMSDCVAGWRRGIPSGTSGVKVGRESVGNVEQTDNRKGIKGFAELCSSLREPLPSGTKLEEIDENYRPLPCQGCTDRCVKKEE